MKSKFYWFKKTPTDWGEGLPTVAPTYNRVKKMLGKDWGKRNDTYGFIKSLNIQFNYYQLASNAVLAGCTPDCWSIVKKCIDILIDPKFNLETVITTIHSQSPLILISGKAADILDIKGGRGSIGPGSKKSIVIGRSVYLFIRNICNGTPQGIDAATQGHLGKVSFCFSENNDLSPWNEYHTRKGFNKNDSTVTIFSSQSPHEVVDLGDKGVNTLLEGLVHTLLNPWTYNSFYNQDVWIIMSPEHAQRIDNSGMSLTELKEYLFDNTVYEKKDLQNRGLYGFIGEVKKDKTNLFRSIENINVVVTGGYPGGYSMVCFGSGLSLTKKVNL
jgi:hypothetical protein